MEGRMDALAVTRPTLASSIWPVTKSDSTARQVLRLVGLALLGTAFVAACAQVQIPWWPVPFTGQTFAVLVLGMVYGARLGAGTLLLYLAVGGLGLPVYAELSSGWAVLTGTTGGYFIGFVLAAGFVGWLAERGWDRSVWLTGLAMVLGNVLIYVPGLLWLGAVVGWDKPILAWGLTPFLLGDAVKLVLAAAALPYAWKLVGRRAR
jgi:biotin transport system substrate-specific component